MSSHCCVQFIPSFYANSLDTKHFTGTIIIIHTVVGMEAQEALSEFVEGLKEAYSERQFITEEQWPPVRGDKLINLQLVEAEKEEGFRAGLPQHGIPDDMVKRTPIIHGNLFHVEKGKKLVRKLIVEGNAGIGKTTLCTMLAEGWAGGNILTQFDCVLLLPLRDPLVSSASSLTGLLALHHPDEIICEPVVRHLKRTRGKEMLIIADGWDELSETNRSKVSFLYNLLFGRLLPSASVLLTSRPSASAPLHDLPSVDRLVEVVGFNEENIKQYIESEFDQFPEKASSLIEQLNNNPVIESVCSVPLNCAIVCNLWHTLDQELPRTLTGLYTQIVLNIILRNIKKKFPDCPIGLNGFDDIPNDLQDTFWLICEFAYECLLLDQLVFSETELSSRLPESGDKLHCFGLLQSARSLLAVGHGLSFHFAHSTIQEFLAALHLATLPNKEKLKVVEAHDDSDRFDIVWRFMFGLASKYHDSCSNQVIGLDDDLMDKYMAFKYGDLASVCHAAFEASDQSLAKKICNVFGENLLYGDFKTPFDCVARFYVLRYALKCDNMVIRISFCAIGDKLLKELTDILSNANGNLQVRDLLLAQTKLSDKGVADLFKRASAAFIALDELSLISNNFTDIMSSFVSCTSLTQLYLSENPLGVFGIQSLETAVRAGVLVRLATLHLSNTLTGDADVNGALLTTLFQSIASHCANLEILSLSDNNLGLPGLCSVVENIPLRLNHIDLKSTHLTNSFHSVSQYTVTSEILNLYPKNLYCLRSMDLTGSNFSGSAGTLLLEKSLQALQSLEELNCSDCSITSVDIAMLIHLLKSANVKCKNLKWWNLGDNNIDDEGVIALTRCLPELFIRLEGFSTSVVYGLTNAVFLIGNPVGEELILMCNEHLKVLTHSLYLQLRCIIYDLCRSLKNRRKLQC